MSRKLTNVYEWRTPLLISIVPVVALALFMSAGNSSTWWVIVLAAFIAWACYAVAVLMRRRAALEIDDADVIHVRRWFATHAVRPGEVTKVRELVNGRSPDVILHTADRRKVVVPSSKLEGGHSVLFRWLQRTCPDAHYDKGATRLRDRLEAGGHLLPELG